MAFLKKTRSITGKTYTKPSIKPSNTRKIIRRFHLLINKKNLIYKKLNEVLFEKEANDDSYEELMKQYGVQPATEVPSEDELLQILNLNSPYELLTVLNKIQYEIEAKGGLQKYQIASLYGQESNRGSDSSKWLFETLPELKSLSLKALEIGSLSTKNVISKYCEVTRIDLNSNDPKILKQDFMERAIPTTDKDKFSLISCSLVLNFVPNAISRGEMLKRFSKFILPNGYIFIVLPLSCVSNSRYCDKEHFTKIMNSLGYKSIAYHEASKLVYMVFQQTRQVDLSYIHYKKVKLHDGSKMNNFCVVVE